MIHSGLWSLSTQLLLPKNSSSQSASALSNNILHLYYSTHFKCLQASSSDGRKNLGENFNLVCFHHEGVYKGQIYFWNYRYACHLLMENEIRPLCAKFTHRQQGGKASIGPTCVISIISLLAVSRFIHTSLYEFTFGY